MQKKILKIALYFLISTVVISCNGQSVKPNVLEKYLLSKKEFDNKIVSHFPDKITNHYKFINSQNAERNDVCFILYEYELNKESIDSITSTTNKAIAKYNSRDTCLLIVNRFQTIHSRKYDIDAEITDSTKINQDCYKKLYPIPNFINYEYPNKNSDLKLDGNFDIYVLEAKSGNHFKKFDLIPNPQMPTEWQNGYSKGIAVSKEKRTIIYWSIIW